MTKSQYILANPRCEVTPHFPPHNDNGINAVQLHHILGANSGRADVVPNIIRVKLFIHDWLHLNPEAGKVVCLWVKQLKGECDWDVLNSLTAKRYPSCLDTDEVIKQCMKFPWVEDMRRELI